MKHLGYFPLRSIMNTLSIKNYIDFYQRVVDYDFSLYEVLSSLVYARAVKPCSKHRTYWEVLPSLYEPTDFSYDQLCSGLGFLGSEYLKIVELFTTQVKDKYGISTSTTYFDCTNFYFEIDREDDFRRKGPSKENQTSPIVGMGLLLDANQIPTGMKMYLGNESEKPVMRGVIDELKQQHNITGRTIHVADKGLNCAENIAKALLNKDGYLFSKSIKQLPETEQVWVLLDNDWKTIKNDDGSTKYMYKSCVDEFTYEVVNEAGKKVKVKLKEKRMVTYNPTLAKKKKFEINKLVEKAQKLTLSKAKKSEYGESSKYVDFKSVDKKGTETGKNAKVSINQEKIDKDLKLAGYNMLVTSEIKMPDKEIYNTYHNLWRIEESFKIMKSDLDARPVFMKTEDTIKGHFLICYITVLLERILQFKILKDEFSTNDIVGFIKKFRLVDTDTKHINVTARCSIIEKLSEYWSLPLTHYFISDAQIKKVLNHKL